MWSRHVCIFWVLPGLVWFSQSEHSLAGTVTLLTPRPIYPTLYRKAPPPIRLAPGSREAIPSISVLKTGWAHHSTSLHTFHLWSQYAVDFHVRCRRRRKRRRSNRRRHTWSRIILMRMIWFRSWGIDLERSLGFGYVYTPMITWFVVVLRVFHLTDMRNVDTRGRQ